MAVADGRLDALREGGGEEGGGGAQQHRRTRRGARHRRPAGLPGCASRGSSSGAPREERDRATTRLEASDHGPASAVNRINGQLAPSCCQRHGDYLAAVAIDPTELVPRPTLGRVFDGARKVRLGDVDPSGRLRLDAAVRYLQDLSADDTADAALPDAEAWVVRKTVLEVHRFPRYLEPLGWRPGARASEATTPSAGCRSAANGGASRARRRGSAWTWPPVGPDASPRASRRSTASRGGRRIKARLVHPAPGGDALRSPWPVRRTDLDVLDHVNNAAYWAAVEETRAEPGDGLRHAVPG